MSEVLLAEVRCHLEVLSVVTDDLLAVPEDLSQVNVVSNRAYWLCGFHFEAPV